MDEAEIVASIVLNEADMELVKEPTATKNATNASFLQVNVDMLEIIINYGAIEYLPVPGTPCQSKRITTTADKATNTYLKYNASCMRILQCRRKTLFML